MDADAASRLTMQDYYRRVQENVRTLREENLY